MHNRIIYPPFNDDDLEWLHQHDEAGTIDVCWDDDGQPHAENGPAIVSSHGQVSTWCNHGTKHRIGGPAVVRTGIYRVAEWYVGGTRIHTWELYQEYAGCSDEEMTMLKLKYGEID